MEKRTLGQWGEKRAANYLRRHGYKIIEMNYTCRGGEIDIIAQKRGFIVFVEVKLRKNADFAQAKEFVTRAKQERIMLTAQLWLAANECELQPRFDVIEIYAPNGADGRISVRHIEDAFCV